MGNCDPYSDSPEPLVVNNHSLLGSKEPTLLCNHEDFSSPTNSLIERYFDAS